MTAKSINILVVLFFFISVLFNCKLFSEEKYKDKTVAEKKQTSAGNIAFRNEKWAKKIILTGVPNFYKINDSLYRGAQPDKKGIENLKKIGIKTIINLRSFNSDRDEMDTLTFNYIHLYAKAWKIEEKEIITFLKTVSDTENQPVFVHCQHGADRTGTMCAFYRIIIQGWSKEDAIDEMVNGGYGYHKVWKSLISLIKKIDAENLRNKINR